MATAAFGWDVGFACGFVRSAAFVGGSAVWTGLSGRLGGGFGGRVSGRLGGGFGDRLDGGFGVRFGQRLGIFGDALGSNALESAWTACGLAAFGVIRRAKADALAYNATQLTAGAVGGLAACAELVRNELDALAFPALCASVGLRAILDTDVQTGKAEQAFFAAFNGITSLPDILASCAVLDTDALLAGVGDALFSLGAGLGHRSGTSTAESLEDQVAGSSRSTGCVVLAKADVDERCARSACVAGRSRRARFYAKVSATCGVLEALKTCIACPVGATRRASRSRGKTAGLITASAFGGRGTLQGGLAGQILGARFARITAAIAFANTVTGIAQQAAFAVCVRFTHRTAHPVVGDTLLEAGGDVFASEVLGAAVACVAGLETTTPSPFGIFAVITATICVGRTRLAECRLACGKLDRTSAAFARFPRATLGVLGTRNRWAFHLVGEAILFAVEARCTDMIGRATIVSVAGLGATLA